MRSKSGSKAMAVFATLAIGLVLVPSVWAGSKEKVLYSFKGGTDGATPVGTLVTDAAGNFYGTTIYGGAHNAGTIFKLTRSAKGWKESVLHAFGATGDGSLPYGSITFDAKGTMYGTTETGGIVTGGCGPYGCGTVFKLTPTSGGRWNETVLHRFDWNAGDGANPVDGVIFDHDGNLYGTTISGGTGACNGNCGTVFRLSPAKNGPWKEQLLYSFVGGNDGANPYAGLVFDTAGSLYGTTSQGGIYGYGTVFGLTSSGGEWVEAVLYSFRGYPNDGEGANSALVLDKAGSLYGTTELGGDHCGPYGCGTVFKLLQGSNGDWSESVLYSFSGDADDRYPVGGLIFHGKGDLYGATSGSLKVQAGTVFELIPASGGNWSEHALHAFKFGKNGEGSKRGTQPSGGIVTKAGNLYGVTSLGGDSGCDGGNGCGVVFEITP